jgi:hypothetical protein
VSQVGVVAFVSLKIFRIAEAQLSLKIAEDGERAGTKPVTQKKES